MSALSPPVLAAVETAIAHGHEPDRKEILQDGNTLVLRLSETLVARVLQDRDGPRRGAEWFARENAVALHLAAKGAPVIPMHPDIPPGPHMHRGYPINFWSYVTDTGGTPEPEDVGRTLFLCHESLRSFEGPLEDLAILHETVELMPMLERRQSFAPETLAMLRRHLDAGL